MKTIKRLIEELRARISKEKEKCRADEMERNFNIVRRGNANYIALNGVIITTEKESGEGLVEKLIELRRINLEREKHL